MSISILVAIIGLVSGVLGGAVSALFTSRLERDKFKRDTKRQLYGEFVETIWTRAAPEGEHTASEIQRANRKFAELATKILIYCSPEVAECLRPIMTRANHFEAQDRLTWQKLIVAMRKDVGEPATNMEAVVDDVIFNRMP